MNPKLQQAVEKLVTRADQTGQQGNRETANAMKELNEAMGRRIPEWYIELLVRFPLVDLELGWQADEPDDEYDGVAWMQWSGANNIRSESLECYPGLAILEKGWINVASDVTGGSDPYFIPTDQGDDPPVFQVYHDVSDKADLVLAKGCRQIAASLSELLEGAKLPTS